MTVLRETWIQYERAMVAVLLVVLMPVLVVVLAVLKDDQPLRHAGAMLPMWWRGYRTIREEP